VIYLADKKTIEEDKQVWNVDFILDSEEKSINWLRKGRK
jgi:hypothetical protein